MDDHQYNGNGNAEPMSPTEHHHQAQPDRHGDDQVHDLRATLPRSTAHGGSSMDVDQPLESAHGRSRTPSRSRSRSRARDDRASRSRSRSRTRTTRDRRSRSRSRSRGRGGRDRDRYRDRRARRDATYSPPRNRSPTPPPRAPRFRRPTADQIKNALATLDPDLRRIFAKHKLMEMWVADPIEAMRMHVFIERQKQLGKTNALVVIPPKKIRDKLGVSALPGGRRDRDRDRGDRDRRGGSSFMTMDSFSHPDLWTARVKFGMGRTEVEKLIRDRDEDVAVRRVTALVIVDV